MCNDRSWKSCSIVTIVFTSMLMLGMFIAIGVMNSMFGDNMQCYVDAAKSHRNHDNRRQMFEGMDKIAAQHPSIAKTLGSAVKQLPAFPSFAPEGRKLQWDDIPNDDSCYLANNGDCDDTTFYCSCGTDYSDCGRRYSRSDCQGSSPPPAPPDKTDEERVEEIENAVLNVFNPAVIIPAIFTSIFTYVGSGLALKDPLKFSCAANGMFITGSIFCFVTCIIYAVATYVLLVYANVVVEIFRTAWGGGYWFDDCLDESRAMFSSAGVGCLIATIGALGAFVSSICASCGICKHETKQKQAPVQGTQMSNVPVATPMSNVPVAAGQPVQAY
jgi:hypothetical protein